MAEKLNMATENIADKNFEILSKLFPNALTETITGYDENGDAIIERAIDADVLRQEISCKVVEGRDERYQFTWPDKKKTTLLANAPITATLRPVVMDEITPSGCDSSGKPYCSTSGVDFDSTQNLYVEGDNLEVLKLLQETYLGKVKMIYIDPPYNTGNDFVYNDDFSESVGEYLPNSGQFDEDGNRLVKNTDTNGRFHTDWLNMLYPRLKLARNLLSDDGICLISIDDNELANILGIVSEIYGQDNMVANFIIVSNSAKNNSKYVSVTHEYLVCVAKDKEKLMPNWSVHKTNCDGYKKITQELLKSELSMDEIHSELLQLVRYPKYYEFDHYTYVDKRGPYRASDLTAPGSKARYNIIHPITNKVCKFGIRGWAYSETEMKKLIEDDYILFGKDETIMPQLKNYLYENEETLPKSVLFFDSQSSTKWMKQNEFGFDFPKAIDYIKYIISMFPTKDFIAMDYFSGSATTAHAIMQLNAEDGGKRKFIMIQLPEVTDEKSQAYKSGYKNICEIGKERIRRAGKKIKEENPNAADLDIGFRVLKLDSSNMKDIYYNPAQMEQQTLFASTDNIKEDRTPEDLLFQVMLDLGVLLSSKIEEKMIAGKKVFNVADGFLIACFDSDITEETVKAVAQEKPYYAVFRDSSMANDSVATNFEQIFATYSPETVRKVL